ncbi:hypothetical protein [Acinetobacter sp. WCHA55]|uniref:hypothetical protein n=1 Tax=Acinetobacter sp. WCHA55 TaxID=2004646 RepID=UPI000B3CD2F9|nr:hypothetical protein [Acinetobacter sp. WCHA55]
MNIQLKKIDWIRWAIYLITVIFLAYLIFICFFAKPDQFLFGNVFIKQSTIDFGGFGSLLAGIFSPLAFLWLVLNFRQQDKSLIIAEKQLQMLIEERQARNKILKPKFKFSNFLVTSFDDEQFGLTTLLTFECESDKDLMKCNLIVFDSFIPLYTYNKFKPLNRYKEMSLRPISANTPTLIRLQFDQNSINKLRYNISDIGIKFLNAEGYEQTERFELKLTCNFSDAGEMYDIKFHVVDWDNIY